MDSRIAHFDPKTARFALHGDNPISFADPMTARAAGYIVAPRPGPVAGVTEVSGESVSVLRRPTVLCTVVGTVRLPPPSGAPPEARPVERRLPASPEARPVERRRPNARRRA